MHCKSWEYSWQKQSEGEKDGLSEGSDVAAMDRVTQ